MPPAATRLLCLLWLVATTHASDRLQTQQLEPTVDAQSKPVESGTKKSETWKEISKNFKKLHDETKARHKKVIQVLNEYRVPPPDKEDKMRVAQGIMGLISGGTVGYLAVSFTLTLSSQVAVEAQMNAAYLFTAAAAGYWTGYSLDASKIPSDPQLRVGYRQMSARLGSKNGLLIGTVVGALLSVASVASDEDNSSGLDIGSVSESSTSSSQSFTKNANVGATQPIKHENPAAGTPLSQMASQMTVFHSMLAGCVSGFMVGYLAPEIADAATGWQSPEMDAVIEDPFEKEMKKIESSEWVTLQRSSIKAILPVFHGVTGWANGPQSLARSLLMTGGLTTENAQEYVDACPKEIGGLPIDNPEEFGPSPIQLEEYGAGKFELVKDPVEAYQNNILDNMPAIVLAHDGGEIAGLPALRYFAVVGMRISESPEESEVAIVDGQSIQILKMDDLHARMETNVMMNEQDVLVGPYHILLAKDRCVL